MTGVYFVPFPKPTMQMDKWTGSPPIVQAEKYTSQIVIFISPYRQQKQYIISVIKTY